MSRIAAICRKEFRSFWYSPIAYIVLIVFLVVMTWLFFLGFYLRNNATLVGLFGFLPAVFIFVIPALTMHQWAEERKSGTLETLMTKPVREWEVVLGKYLASAGLIAILLLLTLPLAFTVAKLSQNGLDWGVALSSYAGAFLLGLAYLAIGSWASSLTTNQIVAFILGVAIIFAGWIVGQLGQIAPSFLVLLFNYLGLGNHFGSISRGVIDSRDLIYYASVVFLFLFLTVRSVESRKWS
ncbi:ABC transporter permease subunit [bacterium]|nr:ABC transporter permease subunit [bacterium]